MTTKHAAILQETLGRLRALGGWLVLMAAVFSRRADPMAAAERLFGVCAVRARRVDDTFST